MRRIGPLLLSTLLLCACPARRPPARDIDAGALFDRACAQCHGEDGRGQTEAGRAVGAKDLTRPETQAKADALLAHQIKVGGGKMPGFGATLDDDEIAALAAHVRSLAPGAAGVPSPHR